MVGLAQHLTNNLSGLCVNSSALLAGVHVLDLDDTIGDLIITQGDAQGRAGLVGVLELGLEAARDARW